MDEPLSNLDAKLRVQMRTEVSRLQKRLGTTTVYVTHDQVEAMTLGDRVAVMRGGDPAGRPARGAVRGPDEPLRRRLHRLAGHELPARKVSGGDAETALGDLRLPAGRGAATRQRRARRHHRHPPRALRGRLADRPTSATTASRFRAKIDLLESLGSDKFAYFTVQSERRTAEHLQELAADAGTGDMGAGEEGVQVTARLERGQRGGRGPGARDLARPGEGERLRPGERREPDAVQGGARSRGRDHGAGCRPGAARPRTTRPRPARTELGPGYAACRDGGAGAGGRRSRRSTRACG